MEEEDPVVAEIDVYHTSALADHLCLFQYPLRPAHLPYHSVVGAKVSKEGCVLLEVGVAPRGENYSTSRGEGFAKMVQLGVKGQDKVYQSGLWDKLALVSDKPTEKPSRYVAAVFKDGDLNLTSVAQILQLKPTLLYLDAVETGARQSTAGSDGEATESEGEEAVPVTVKFARKTVKGQNVHLRKKSFAETKAREWIEVAYHGVESYEATQDRRELFASEDSTVAFDLSSSDYLNTVCPMDQPVCTAEPVAMPTGVLSLSQLKSLPLEQQLRKLLLNVHVERFGKLCSLLGVTGSRGVLQAVGASAVLVQGCWVVKSQLLFPDNPTKAAIRDHILWCFTQRRVVGRKEIVGVVKLPTEELREMLRLLAVSRVSPPGWEFKLDTDVEFLNKHLSVTHDQEQQWTARHSQLISELALKTPVAVKQEVKTSMVSGSELVKTAQKQCQERSIRREPVEATSNEELLRAVEGFCRESLGRGVLGLTELKSKLLLCQSAGDHPLLSMGVSDATLMDGVRACGAVEVGGPAGRQLYALTHGEKIREVILPLFQQHKSVRKKMVVEQLDLVGVTVSDKALVAALKELCYSKGSQWKLLGTD